MQTIRSDNHLASACLNPPRLPRPLAPSKVPAGFASPAQDYRSKSLDLNEFLIRNRVATFFFEVTGFSMRDAGINDGDLLVVDRSIEAKHGSIVVASVNGDELVKILYKQGDVVELHSANPAYDPICFSECDEMTIWGVVTSIIRVVKG